MSDGLLLPEIDPELDVVAPRDSAERCRESVGGGVTDTVGPPLSKKEPARVATPPAAGATSGGKSVKTATERVERVEVFHAAEPVCACPCANAPELRPRPPACGKGRECQRVPGRSDPAAGKWRQSWACCWAASSSCSANCCNGCISACPVKPLTETWSVSTCLQT